MKHCPWQAKGSGYSSARVPTLPWAITAGFYPGVKFTLPGSEERWRDPRETLQTKIKKKKNQKCLYWMQKNLESLMPTPPYSISVQEIQQVQKALRKEASSCKWMFAKHCLTSVKITK